MVQRQGGIAVWARSVSRLRPATVQHRDPVLVASRVRWRIQMIGRSILPIGGEDHPQITQIHADWQMWRTPRSLYVLGDEGRNPGAVRESASISEICGSLAPLQSCEIFSG